jgi:hypothetical protein
MKVYMTETERSDLIETAYYRDCGLASRIVRMDEEISGVRPATLPMEDLVEQLDCWLVLAKLRWLTGKVASCP